MAAFFLKRILLAGVTILLIACITFAIMKLVPGGPFLSEKAPSEAVLQAMEEKYGLDKPFLVQLGNYLGGLLQGDMGVSYRMQKGRAVTDIIGELFPVSARLGAISLVLAVGIGVPLGAISAYRKGTALDSTLRVGTTLGIAIPAFVLATVLLAVFGVQLQWFPTIGLEEGPASYVLPCLTLAFYPMCYISRLTRSSMLDAIHQDYMRTARAKGVGARGLIFKHALRNSLIPVITYLGPLTASILSGAFVVESVFTIPGLGRYFIQSITNRDYPLIMGTTIFFASLIVILNLVVDLLYHAVDPRIQLTKGGK